MAERPHCAGPLVTKSGLSLAVGRLARAAGPMINRSGIG
jgi:hypothetical protein